MREGGLASVGDGAWPSCYVHKEVDSLLSVCLDDVKLASPTSNMEKGWKFIASSLTLDPPQPLSLHLGCIHERKEVAAGAVAAQVMSYTMDGLSQVVGGAVCGCVPCCPFDVCSVVRAHYHAVRPRNA